MAPRRSLAPSEETPSKPSRSAGEATAKVTKRGRGRPPMDPSQRKTKAYVPTGKPRGRPPGSGKKTAKAAAAKPKVEGRGRGRPKKSEEVEEPKSAKKGTAVAKGGPAKRKSGGRKSLTKDEEEKEEEDAEEESED